LGEGLLARDDDNEYLALDGLKDEPVLQIQGYSMTYPIATGKQQGRKVFTLQTIAAIAAMARFVIHSKHPTVTPSPVTEAVI
jgi:hypothetical protein